MLLYKITNNENGMIYIGQTARNLSRRWTEHKRKCSGSTMYLSRAIAKQGKTSFSIEKLDDFLSQEELNKAEKEAIERFNCLSPNGYNLNTGGKNHYNDSEETRLKKSLSKLGKPSNATGQTPWNKGLIGAQSSHFKKSVICLNDGSIYESISAAAKKLKTTVISISRVCHGMRNTVHGHKFAFIQESL